MSKPTIREITYCFGDASVPPQYHRSYTITITPRTVHIVVDSYGETLAEQEHGITEEKFQQVVLALDQNGIQQAALGEDEGCTGGTSETISYRDEDRELFSGTVYHCGGRDTGNLGGDVKGFADVVRRLVPNLEDLLE